MKTPKIILSLSLVYAVTGYALEQDVVVVNDPVQNTPIDAQATLGEDNESNTLFITKTSATEPAAVKSNKVINLNDVISDTISYTAILSA